MLDNLTDGTHHTPNYTTSGIRFISVSNIRENQIDFLNTKYISDAEHLSLIKRCYPKAEDILLTKVGTIGRAAVVEKNAPAFSLFVSVALLQVKKDVSSYYLCAYLNSSLAKQQFERHVKGIGVPDLHLENIAQTQVVLPDRPVQDRMAADYFLSFGSYQKKLQQAHQLIFDFERFVESSFNFQKRKEKNIYAAVHYGSLDGVIDVKRYLTPKEICPLQVSDVCDIVEEKINISALGGLPVDWIRIDDLPNKPLEIETVRTQPANEIQGSFFPVQAGDILVARLGPTILNQKVVLVQQTERTTIASAEFLVLRCKPGFAPEAVMAVLKTSYFSRLMYAHSRGSTPSRYRLNREDMLKLPFPDITDIQSALASQASCVRKQVKTLRQQAEQEWQAAKEQFEKELLGE